MAVTISRFALVVALALPLSARAEVRLLDEELRPPDTRSYALLTVQEPSSRDAPRPGSPDAKGTSASGTPSDGGSLDFDLLGEAKAPPPLAIDKTMARRRRILGWHQTIGLGLVAAQLGTTVAGQLNYNDKFGDANTGRYKLTHATFAYTALGLFAVNGALALIAPDAPAKPNRGFDRVTLHKISMFTAAAGMATQAALGIYTSKREGYENKQDIGTAHLIVGYVTLAAITAGVSAIVF